MERKLTIVRYGENLAWILKISRKRQKIHPTYFKSYNDDQTTHNHNTNKSFFYVHCNAHKRVCFSDIQKRHWGEYTGVGQVLSVRLFWFFVDSVYFKLTHWKLLITLSCKTPMTIAKQVNWKSFAQIMHVA